MKKKRKIEKDFSFNYNVIKNKLEEYEDELLEIISENPEELKNIAVSKGISSRGQLTDIISKLVYLKEQCLINEYQLVNFLILCKKF